MVQLNAIGFAISAAFCFSGHAAAGLTERALPLAGSVMTSYRDDHCGAVDGGPNGFGVTCQHWGGSQLSFSLNDLFVNTKDCANLSLHWYKGANCQGTASVVYRNVQANKCYQYLTHEAEWAQLVCNNPNL